MIRQLHQRGAHLVDIAHQIGCSERTVRRHLAREEAPTGRPARPRASKLDPYKPIIDQLLADNVWNAEVIFQLIREQGYSGGSTIVRMYIQPKRALRPSKPGKTHEKPFYDGLRSELPVGVNVVIYRF